MSEDRDEIPEIIEGKVPPGVTRQTQQYLEEPRDEIPMVDSNNPGRATGIPVEEFSPQLLRIMSNFDPRPLLIAVNEAVRSNDINKVVAVWQSGRIEVVRVSKTLLNVTLRPAK